MPLLASLFSRRRRYTDLSVSIHEHIAEKIDELDVKPACRAKKRCAGREALEFGNVSTPRAARP